MHIGLGMRSIKTGIAVLACLSVYTYTPLNDPVLAVVVSVASIQNSIDDSVTFSKNRIIGTILGTVLGIAYKQVAQNNLFLTSIGVILLIIILNTLKQSRSILIAMTVFVSIITGVATGNHVLYGLNKFINTLVGITIGFLINYLIKPPSQIENMKAHILEIVEEIEKMIQELIFSDDRIDLDKLRGQIQGMEHSLNIYNQDKKYNTVAIDKIRNVERTIQDYRKLYSQIALIKDKRAILNEENMEGAQLLFERDYVIPENTQQDESYTTVYNYHIKDILEEVKKIRIDFESISTAKTLRRDWKVLVKIGSKNK